jgi:hypothetical protein
MHALLDDGYKHTVEDVLIALNRWTSYIHDAKPNKPLHRQFRKAKRDAYERIYKYRHSKKSKWIGKRGRI